MGNCGSASFEQISQCKRLVAKLSYESTVFHFRKRSIKYQSEARKWFPRSQETTLPAGIFFSDAHLIVQLANWIIDQIFEIELGLGNCSDWHETRRNEVFRPKFAKMGPGEPIFGRKIEQKWNKNESF